MARSAALSLMEGLQGGYKFSTDVRRNRQIEKALDFELAGMSSKRKADDAAFEKFGEAYGGWEDYLPETWGSRALGWMKGKLGMGQGAGAGAQQQAISPSDMGQNNFVEKATEAERFGSGAVFSKHGGATRVMKYANGGRSLAPDRTTGYAEGGMVAKPIGYYAHGGTVEETGAVVEETEEEKRARYRAEIQAGRDAPTSGGGVREATRDVGRSAAGYFDKTIKGALGGDKLIEDADAVLARAKGAREIGQATRGTGAAALTAAGETIAGLATDVFVENPITQGALGFLGFGERDKEAAVQAIPKDETPDETAAAVAAQPAPAQPTGGVGGSGVGQVTPGAATPATGADQTGVEDDQMIDFSQVTDVRPDALPSKGQKEWEKERNFYAAQAIANGRDPLEAMKAVDEKQMRGFSMYGQQAHQLILAGNPTGAINALYAAYQYFPNGVDVKFGLHKGKDGRSIIIGMGTDEETGEPIKEGKPMVITAESLAVQIENFMKPGALRAWTKDWQAAEHKAREYMEVTKPQAQADVTYKAKAGDALLMNAQANLQKAIISARGGGLKQSDFDRAFSEMNKDTDTMALFESVPPEDADYLKAVMAVAYKNSPGNFPSTSQLIKQAYRDGGIAAVDEMVGGGDGQ